MVASERRPPNSCCEAGWVAYLIAADAGTAMKTKMMSPMRAPQSPGLPPSLIRPPQGCHFRPRCPHAHEACLAKPELLPRVGGETGHEDRCVLSPERKRALRETDGQIGLVAGGVTE